MRTNNVFTGRFLDAKKLLQPKEYFYIFVSLRLQSGAILIYYTVNFIKNGKVEFCHWIKNQGS